MQHFKIGFDACMTINFSPKLQWLTGGKWPIWGACAARGRSSTGVSPHTVEQMGINAGHLRRGVSAQAQSATRELIDQLEGL